MTTYTVTSGAISSGIVVGSGDELDVLSGGVARSTVVSSGGVANVSAGGVASGTVLNDGGTEYVYSGGVAMLTVVSSGGRRICLQWRRSPVPPRLAVAASNMFTREAWRASPWFVTGAPPLSTLVAWPTAPL